MSVSGISSSNLWDYATQSIQSTQSNQSNQSNWQKMQQEFQQLGTDLQSGNLSAAQSDLVTLQKDLPQGSSSTTESSDPLQQAFTQLAKDIQSGKFAKNWVAEYQGGYKRYHALLKKGEAHPIEKTGAKLRALMPWMGKKNIKGAQAAY